MTLIMKVLCEKCGKKIGEVHREAEDIRYRPLWQDGAPSSLDSISSPQFWCLDHGFTHREEIDAAIPVSDAANVPTLRAKMHRRTR